MLESFSFYLDPPDSLLITFTVGGAAAARTCARRTGTTNFSYLPSRYSKENRQRTMFSRRVCVHMTSASGGGKGSQTDNSDKISLYPTPLLTLRGTGKVEDVTHVNPAPRLSSLIQIEKRVARNRSRPTRWRLMCLIRPFSFSLTSSFRQQQADQGHSLLSRNID